METANNSAGCVPFDHARHTSACFCAWYATIAYIKKRSTRQCLHVLLLSCFSFALAGCGGMGSGSPVSWDAPKPLSAKELTLFEETGQLDRNLSDDAKRAVLYEYSCYLRQRRATIAVGSQRANKFLTQTRQAFREQGVPEELAYLAIVESGYNTQARSPAGAAGAWQFIPSTGKRFGLTQDKWMDERLDPYRSAEAAAQYLKRLYGQFGDWNVAIAAYNAGEGKMMRARKGTGQREFFAIVARNNNLDGNERLKPETINYVPRFLAVSKIMRNLEPLGFRAIQPENAPRMMRISAKPGTDLKTLAKITRVPWDEFSLHNAAHKRTITCTSRLTNVYVPDSRVPVALAYMENGMKRGGDAPEPTVVARGKARTITAGRSDTWVSISRKTGVPISALIAANKGVKLGKGTVNVRVPVLQQVGSVDNDGFASPSFASAEKTMQSQTTHVVRSGDSMWSIAQRYNVSPTDLMRWNKRDDGAIHPGDKLIVQM
jgi:membrane-bound lytic murein transglycosylase D